jgi:hypothetical protein
MRAEVIPAYPYSPYKDDDQIYTFFKGFNGYAQDYIDSFNALNLPIYNSKIGTFLDWVGNNIYGIPRPVFPVGYETTRGELNSTALNEQALNELIHKFPENYVLANDDVYRRVITWHHWKGDGDVFNVRTLKRRIMRFLTNQRVDQTYQVSVSFGLNNQVNITIYQNSFIPAHPSAILNDSELNRVALNELTGSHIPLPVFDLAQTFKTAILTGALSFPFQYQTPVINII